MTLPQGWAWTTLGEIADTTRRRSLPQEHPDLPFIGMENIEAQTMRLLGTVPAVEMKSSAEHFEPGDVLYGRLRPYLNKVFCPEFEGLCSSEFIVFRRSPHLASEYLQYFLNSWDFVTFASHLNTGDRPRVNFDQLAEYPFPFAPLSEQHRVVAEIEKQFTRLDAGVAALKRVQANLKRYKASVLKAACEGRLVPQDPNDEPASELLARILAERRVKWEQDLRAKGKDPSKAKYVEPQPPDEDGLPGLPEGWCYTLLGPLLSITRTGMRTGPFGSLLKKHEHKESGVPVLGIENIESMRFVSGSKIHITQAKAKQLSNYTVQPGDVLISRSGTVGEVCVVPDGIGEAVISTNLMRVVLAPNDMLPSFFTLLFNGSPFVLKQVSELCSGSTRDFLNQEILSTIVFPFPPLAEQRRIVAEVERRLSVVQEVEAVIAANLARAERLRQSILKQAFEGKLVPQDPNDEPASVLLERIKAHRAGATLVVAPRASTRSAPTKRHGPDRP